MGLFSNLKRAIRSDSAIREDWIDRYRGTNSPAPLFDQTGLQLDPDHQDWQRIEKTYKTNGIAKKMIDKVAEDMTRAGWHLVITNEPELEAKYEKALDDLQLQTSLCKGKIFERLYGDSYIHIGVVQDGNADVSKPLDPTTIRKVLWVHPFGQQHVTKVTVNNDPTSNDYGQEQQVIVNPTSEGTVIKNGMPVEKEVKNNQVIIDKTRYFHLRQGDVEDDGFGVSMLTICQDPLNVLDKALQSVGKILYGYVIKVYKSAGVKDLNKNQREALQDRLSDAFTTQSVFACSTDEDLTTLSMNTSGISDLLDFGWQSLAAASNIPKSVLTGQEAGTITGAQYDVVNYYDDIQAKQQTELKPILEYIVRLLMYSKDVAGGPIDPDSLDWHIEFNLLWSETDLTKSQVFVNKANAVTSLMNSNVIDSQQGAAIMNGKSTSVNAAVNDSADPVVDKAYEEAYKKLVGEIHGKETK